MNKGIKRALQILLLVYIIICTAVYFLQEKLIFFPNKLPAKYNFSFNQPFEEITVKTNDDVNLKGLLFKTEAPKGVILYLHGNAGSLKTWSDVAPLYTNLYYEVLIMDYRGFGKSEGDIQNQEQLYNDVQLFYNLLLKRYPENNIIVLGYSIGTGPAAWLASENHPRMLILQAPYYNLTDLMQQMYPLLPAIILKYPFPTNEYLLKCKMPVVIFHGDKDEVIYYGSSVRLSK
ncbi:MAG: alpha/beta fold hydrolase, partial [Bacteroidota bacterium]